MTRRSNYVEVLLKSRQEYFTVQYIVFEGQTGAVEEMAKKAYSRSKIKILTYMTETEASKSKDTQWLDINGVEYKFKEAKAIVDRHIKLSKLGSINKFKKFFKDK